MQAVQQRPPVDLPSAERPIHTLPQEEVYRRLGTSPQGLSEAEAAARLARYGPNVLPEEKRTPLVVRFLAQFVHLFAALLWVAAGLAFVGGLPELGWAIIVVIAVNAVFSFWQEYKAERAIEALRDLLPPRATVVREGEERKILARDLVPGDVLILAEGDLVSADARLVAASQLRTNQAALTGESLPVPKTAEPILEPVVSPLEAANLVFAGTTVATGTGRAVVFATNGETQFGRVAHLTQTVSPGPTPLERQLERVTRVIALLAVGIGVVFFALGLLTGLALIEGFLFAVGVIVANVPEGLLPTLTLALAIAVQRMARRNALVKQLVAVETLGACTVICTDKTGTLTANEMTVQALWIDGQMYQVTGVGYQPEGEVLVDSRRVRVEDDERLATALRALVLANNGRLLPPGPRRPRWTALGDPTEVALLTVAAKGGMDYRREWQEHPRWFELPFDSARKRMTTINRVDGQLVAFVKGAPLETLERCSRVLTRTGVVPLDEGRRREIRAANDALARAGLRVLAAAMRPNPPRGDTLYTPDEVERDLIFLGLVAMQDPPRPEVVAAVGLARRAGIRVIMITGDYGLTAEAIARKIGLVRSPTPRIVSGSEMATLSQETLRRLVREPEVIFARVAPSDKLRVVQALKAQGEIVAVTGDGVNDAPALKGADIGVAMGITGTDVAKEASSLILLDDNFATIVAAVEQGRAVYDNIRKFVTYIFASNVPELVPFLLFVFVGIPLPLTVLQILAVDLGTDLLPALALGAEPPEPDVMDRPPQAQQRPLLDRPLLSRAYGFLGVIETVAAMSGYFWVYLTHGWQWGLPLPESGPVYRLATTMTFACIVASQVGNAFATRTERTSVFSIGLFSNRLLLLGILVEIALLAALSYVPVFHGVFNTAPMRPIDWAFLLIWPPLLLAAEEARKAVVRRRDGRRREA